MLQITSSPNDLSLSKHRMIYVLKAFDGAVPHTSNTLPDGYQVTMQLHFEKVLNSGVFEVVATVQQKTNASAEVAFDVHEILDSEIQANFPSPPIPAFDQSEPYLLETFYQYYITFKEEYVNFSGEYESSLIKNVLYGGIYQDEDFFALQDVDNSLIGDYPNGKRIGFNQPEFISWFNYTDNSVQVQIELNTISGEGAPEITVVHASNSINVAAGQVIVLPVGPSIIQLPDTTAFYSVQVIEKGTDARLSERREYYIDRHYQPYARYLMYLNVFGAPETIRCTGAMDFELSIERQIAEVLNDTNGIFRYAKQQYGVVYDDYFTFRTGYIQIEEVRALRELLIHNQLWEVTEEGFSALLIQTDSFSYKQRDFLFSIEFKTTPAAGQSFAGGVSAISWDSTRLGAGNPSVVVQTRGYIQRYPNHQTAELIWTENNGVLPADTFGFLFVTKDGIELDEGLNYTVHRATGPGQSTIALIDPEIGANYKVRAQSVEVVFTTDLQADETTVISDDDGTIISDDDGIIIDGFPS